MKIKSCFIVEPNQSLVNLTNSNSGQQPMTSFDRDRDLDSDRDSIGIDHLNMRDDPPDQDNFIAALNARTADFDELNLLIYRYGRNMDWK